MKPVTPQQERGHSKWHSPGIRNETARHRGRRTGATASWTRGKGQFHEGAGGPGAARALMERSRRDTGAEGARWRETGVRVEGGDAAQAARNHQARGLRRRRSRSRSRGPADGAPRRTRG